MLGRHSLLLKIILSRATRLATRKGTCVFPLASMDLGMTSKMTAGGEAAAACVAAVFFLHCRVGRGHR